MAARLTALDFVNLGRDRMGRSSTARHDLWTTFNRAGHQLVVEHPWTWRDKGAAVLASVAGQEYIALGADVETIFTVEPYDGNQNRVQLEPLADIERRRSAQLDAQSLGLLYVSLEGRTTKASPTAATVRNLEVFPTPAASANLLRITYRQRWVDLSDTPANQLPITGPEYDSVLLQRFFMEIALTIGDDWTMHKAAYDEGIRRLKIADAATRAVPARITGGADRFMLPNQIQPPRHEDATFSWGA